MNHLRSITLKVELSPGTDIRDGCCDICELANRIGCLIEANFNGVILLASEWNNPLKLAEEYSKALSSKSDYKIAKTW